MEWKEERTKELGKAYDEEPVRQDAGVFREVRL